MIAIFFTVVAVVIFLFVFYYYVRDDLYFIRKGVSMEQLFNILFIGLFVSLISSRIFFLILNIDSSTTKFPLSIFTSRPAGISLFGGLLGLITAYMLLTKKRKVSRKRFFDYISVALTAFFIVLFSGVYPSIYLFIMYLTLFLFSVLFLMPKYINGRLKPGSLSLIIFIMMSLISFLQDIFLLYTSNILLSKESFLFLGLFIIALILLIRSEMRKTGK